MSLLDVCGTPVDSFGDATAKLAEI
jgi:hypothetical protein